MPSNQTNLHSLARCNLKIFISGQHFYIIYQPEFLRNVHIVYLFLLGVKAMTVLPLEGDVFSIWVNLSHGYFAQIHEQNKYCNIVVISRIKTTYFSSLTPAPPPDSSVWYCGIPPLYPPLRESSVAPVAMEAIHEDMKLSLRGYIPNRSISFCWLSSLFSIRSKCQHEIV